MLFVIFATLFKTIEIPRLKYIFIFNPFLLGEGGRESNVYCAKNISARPKIGSFSKMSINLYRKKEKGAGGGGGGD